MSNAADKKRRVILPPPSPNSAKISGEFRLAPAFQRKNPARRREHGEVLAPDGESGLSNSFVHELEPFDSERVTEVPTSDEMFESAHPRGDLLRSDLLRVDASFETIPAPALVEE